jgi:DNA-directed RNA polymerase specialized sigma24 family protein
LIARLLKLIEPQFSESTRTAFRRLAMDGAKGREVAAELNLSLSAVFDAKSRVTRELRRLGKGMID